MSNLSHLKGRKFREETPSISMDITARYKSHSFYSSKNIVGKPLTDHQIYKYEQMGKYSGEKITPPVKKKRAPSRATLTKKAIEKMLGL